MTRNIIQIAAIATESERKAVYALCDDHTVWVARGRETQWSALQPIPQPPPVDPTRPCVGCVHYRTMQHEEPRCAQPRDRGTDPVSGQRLDPIVHCKDERLPEGGCGPEGALWTAP